MSRLAFFDTNVLVYADDPRDPEKRARAVSLFGDHFLQGTAVVSLQVLQEYYVAVTGKLRVDPAIAQEKVELISHAKIARLNERGLLAAIELHRLRQISLWDALIVQAAKSAGCQTLFTEDLQHGLHLGDLKVLNPFAAQ